MAKYLDSRGVTTLWDKIKSRFNALSVRIDGVKTILDNKANVADLSNVVGEEVIGSPLSEEINTLTRDTIKKDLFIDMWNQACGTYGKYNAATGYFELNGLTDISYEEALAIYKFGDYNSFLNIGASEVRSQTLQQYFSLIRTTLPTIINADKTYPTLGWLPSRLEVIRFSIQNTNPDVRKKVFKLVENNLGVLSNKLIAINDLLTPTRDVKIGFEGNGEHLETIYVHNLAYNIHIAALPVISLESLQYMVTNAANTSPITITVHPDVYAKLTDTSNTEWNKVLTDAAAKQIAFATA